MHKTPKKILLFGDTGKMGTALLAAHPANDTIIRHNSSTFDASNSEAVNRIIREADPDVVINTVAFLGIDACEQLPDRAFEINTIFPRLLAELSKELGFILVHFSSESVFSDSDGSLYSESDAPHPINIYGLSKFGGDCMIEAYAEKYYIFRIALLFGPTARESQLVERMIARVRKKNTPLKISDDIVCTPTYSVDAASTVIELLSQEAPYGIYHLVNSGITTLHELISYVMERLELPTIIDRASHTDFPSIGRKNTCTPLRSEKIPAQRSWKEAADDYCQLLSRKDTNHER